MKTWIDHCHFGDVRAVLHEMIAAGVQVNTIVTSPPYWGLRSYLPAGHADKSLEIGSEPTLREFLDTMVEVFDLCRQVLRDDGTMWVNMGDSYAGSWGSQGRQYSGVGVSALSARQVAASQRKTSQAGTIRDAGFKPKDLMGQPWRLAFALQDAGWWLRQDIIWHKPNPMPESVTDRCTKAHEYMFLLTKSERYYFDQEAIREPVTKSTTQRLSQDVEGQAGSERANGGAKTNGRMKAVGRGVGWGHGTDAEDRQRGRVARKLGPKASLGTSEFDGAFADGAGARMGRGAGWRSTTSTPNDRNKRSVWTVATQSYSGAHFATFPKKLIEPCILAGAPVGGIVLDPFFGSGTTGQVAQQLGRHFIGIDLNRANEPLQADRLRQTSLMLEVA